MEVLMKKNIIVLSIVAVLGVSQAAGMKLTKLQVQPKAQMDRVIGELKKKFGESKPKNDTSVENMNKLGEALMKATLFLKANVKNNQDLAKKMDELKSKRLMVQETVSMPKKQNAVILPEVEAPKVEKKQQKSSAINNDANNSSKKGFIAKVVGSGLFFLASGFVTAMYLLPNMI